MKLPNNLLTQESSHVSNGINTFTLLAISLVWGHMLGLISLWFLPLTIVSVMVGYGTEVQARRAPKSTTLSL